MNKIYVVIFLLIFHCSAWASEEGYMEAFPPSDKGMVRHVLNLPKKTTESEFKIELIAGKTVFVDNNNYFFNGQIKSESIEGWGFTKYVVSGLGLMSGTLMASDPSIPKTDRFITLVGEQYLINYNSRLPIVVYSPEGVEVRYRIWGAGNIQEIK
jgi:ecotin